MHVTLTTIEGDVYTLEVSDDMDLESFRALCSIETNIPTTEVLLRYEGRELVGPKNPLKSFNIRDYDMLLVERKQVPNLPSTSSSTVLPNLSSGPQLDPVALRQEYLSDPAALAVLRHNNPNLAAALEAGIEEFTRFINEQQRIKMEREQQKMRTFMANPFGPEAQRMIAEEIQLQNIESNMEAAMEYHPESFGQVTMLYINCKVNGHPVKAFIDSGAQATIMSKRCAEKCDITRLIDSRWAGIAKGVGEQRITGRIHLCQVQIENDFLPSSFTILEEQEMDMLLGLDMLRRHQCCIDLKKNLLLIGTTGTETKFLGEHEIPKFGTSDARRADGLANSVAEDPQLAEALNRSIIEAQASTSNQSSNNSYSEEALTDLLSMGFDREAIIKELVKFNNDKQRAMAALLAQSMKMP